MSRIAPAKAFGRTHQDVLIYSAVRNPAGDATTISLVTLDHIVSEPAAAALLAILGDEAHSVVVEMVGYPVYCPADLDVQLAPDMFGSNLISACY